MKQSLEELLSVAYQYYARGVWPDDPAYQQTVEYRRLVQARKEAGAEGNPWRVLLDRLYERLPNGKLQNGSLHLPGGGFDACYSGRLWLEPRGVQEKNHELGFLISFLVPSYVVYSFSMVAVPGSDPHDWEQKINFVLSADEQLVARIITEEILSVFPGYEPMPPEVGNTIVPDVATGLRYLGKATIFDCLFTDHW
jgi:hypothetical protein